MAKRIAPVRHRVSIGDLLTLDNCVALPYEPGFIVVMVLRQIDNRSQRRQAILRARTVPRREPIREMA